MNAIYGLTLWQPWASLVASGDKVFETRSWTTAYRGPLIIHAAKVLRPMYRELCYVAPFARALGRFADTPTDLPRGVALALVDLVEIETTEEWARQAPKGGRTSTEEAFGNYASGRYAWRLTNLRRFREPIPRKGRQRLWRPEPRLLTRIQEQLGGIA